MKKHFLVLLALALAVGVGAEPSLNDNLDAQVVVARHDKAVSEAKRAYDLAVAKAATTAIKELQHVQADEAKMGRLEVAMAAKRKIEELQPLTTVSAAPKNDRLVVGKWTWHAGRTALFKADGTATQNDGTAEFGKGTWVPTKDGTVRIQWTEPVAVDILTLNGDTARVINTGSGIKFNINRLPADDPSSGGK
jgi:hypothetical protein